MGIFAVFWHFLSADKAVRAPSGWKSTWAIRPYVGCHIERDISPIEFWVVFRLEWDFLCQMRRCLALLFCVSWAFAAPAATGRVIKVLPHFLDLQGRHTLSPSLFDRDAYQAVLRDHPEQRSAIRFDIEWKSKDVPPSPLKMQLEVRGLATTKTVIQLKFEKTVERTGWLGGWTSLTVKGDDYKKLGDLTAWRVTLWEGNRLLSEQKSFLW
jgi:hypothetical protein